MADSKTQNAHFYLTTPIYYVNARPHLGHAYSTIVCDAIARRKRALGIDTWFLTGTDEHGQKIERSAKLANRTPIEFATHISGEFRALWDRLGLTYDDFIRTTEERHKRGVQKLFATLRDRGFIYKSTYTGQYCVSDEAWMDVAPGAPCPTCGKITETVSVRAQTPRVLRRQPRLHAARIDAQRSHLLRKERPQRPLRQPDKF
jgi:methionyl-tRNA synthetase